MQTCLAGTGNASVWSACYPTSCNAGYVLTNGVCALAGAYGQCKWGNQSYCVTLNAMTGACTCPSGSSPAQTGRGGKCSDGSGKMTGNITNFTCQ